ncbi:MAG: SDR family oxidoreductase [Vicinamibacteria bacterium]|nr:SDR family oxidoreductase [Vicinamibacteria bacterium]
MAIPFRTNLTGKVAVVTGGTGVLCGRMAKALGECGASVAVLGRRKQVADGLAEEICKAGGRAIGVSADVLDRARLEAANAEIEKELGPVDILLNGAGGNHPKGTTSAEYLKPEDAGRVVEGATSFYDLSQEGIEYVFNLNFLGTFLPCQVFTKSMVARRKGVIINVSSLNALKPLTKIPAYSAAKAAVTNFTQWLAVHLSPANIRVNAIVPGFFLTEQNRALLTKPDGSLTARGEKIVGHTPMGRFGKAEELLGALLWLADDGASGFVTGSIITVDGGFSAYSGV